MKLRMIKPGLNEIVREDPNSSLTEYAIRQMVINGEISHIRRGRKILIDLDELKEYLSSGARNNGIYAKTGNAYIMRKVKN